MKSKTSVWIASLASLLLAGTALWWSPLNQDEGWYLMAAQRVSEGYLPYRDFAFTQAPLFPLLYQVTTPLVQEMGLLGGRIITLLFSVFGMGVLLLTIRKLSTKSTYSVGALILLLLVGLNTTYLQFSTTVKTYALAGFFLSGGIYFLAAGMKNPSRFLFVLSGMCCGLATGTRISLVVFAVPIFWHVFREHRHLGIQASVCFLAGFSAVCLGLFLPFAILAPEGLWFGIWEFHAGRLTDSPLLTKGAFVLRWFRSIFPVVIGLLALWPYRSSISSLSKTLLLSSALVTIVHLIAPFPYDEYQTVLLPVLALVLALEIPKQFPQLQSHSPAPILLLAILFALTSPSLEIWFGGEKDRLWWPAKTQSDLSRLRDTADKLEELDPQGTLLLTQDTYLAIEANRDVPRGLEMGPFSYFPTFSDEKAKTLQVLHQQGLLSLLQSTQATSAAVSGYGFAIQSPMLTPTPLEELTMLEQALRSRFEFTEETKAYGQALTTLRLYQR